MVGIIDRYSVKQEKILVGPAAPHIDPAGSFSSGLNTWHQLYGFYNIGLTHKHGNGLDFFYRDGDRAHLDILHHILGPVGGDHYFINFK